MRQRMNPGEEALTIVIGMEPREESGEEEMAEAAGVEDELPPLPAEDDQEMQRLLRRFGA